jgi:hypothetical protein
MSIKIETVDVGTVALIQQTETGRILQVAMSKEQSQMLQIFLASLSQSQPLIQMGKDHDLILKSNACKRCQQNGL